MLKKKSFKTRLMVMVISLVLISTVVIDIISINLIYNTSIDNASQLVQKIEGENVAASNAVLGNVEKSVTTLYNYVMADYEKGLNLPSDGVRKEHIEEAAALALNLVTNTEGAVSVFYRFDKYTSYSSEGVFYGLSGNRYVNMGLLDVNDYSPGDYDHVGWYYQTIAAGKATWIDPYFEEQVEKKVIAYCIPIYVSNSFIGLVGMEADLDLLRTTAEQISAYDTGYGFLLEADNDVVYHPQYPEGTNFSDLEDDYKQLFKGLDSNRYVTRTQIIDFGGRRMWVTCQTLSNDMTLGTVIMQAEILAPIYHFFLRAVLLSLGIIIAAVIASVASIRSLTKPLNELTSVAEEVAMGNMQVSIKVESEDEFGRLAEAFRVMRDEIVKSFAYMNGLAYSDMMTGVNNKGAFERDSDGITQTCIKHEEAFAVVVVDVNNLKVINDTLGHIVGDELIKGVANELTKIFGKRNTYRTGGDEFCVLVRGTNETEIKSDLENFEKGIRQFSEENQGMFHQDITAASGYSFFDPAKDRDFSEVYHRADDYMYARKLAMKGQDPEQGGADRLGDND